MEMKKCVRKKACGVFGCENSAKFEILGMKQSLCLCEDCMRELYQQVGKNIVPRAVISQYKYPKIIKGEM